MVPNSVTSFFLAFALTTSLMLVALHRVSGHGAMTFPKPRNALDGALDPWAQWAYPCDAKHQGDMCKITFCEHGKDCQGSCPISAHSGSKNALNASNGQSCYWFSNGCTVGCSVCDGTQNHVGHGNQRFLYKGMSAQDLNKKNISIQDLWTAGAEFTLNPTSTHGLEIKANCDHPTMNATMCASSLRSANTAAKCGSAEDIYYYSPWRAPGFAPVIDSCGSAGGRHPGQGTGGAGAQFQNTSLAQAGDVGSRLPPSPSPPVWQRGQSHEVGWTVMANHGGGYAYRLAPADAPLTEATFRKLPLDFSGNSALRWDGDLGTQLEFDPEAKGWQTSHGTMPQGSMWRKNPIPSGLWEREGAQFAPVCEESDECIRGYTIPGCA